MRNKIRKLGMSLNLLFVLCVMLFSVRFADELYAIPGKAD